MCSSILIVEDNESIRDPVAMLLRRRGYEVLEAENGWEALELLQARPRLALILLDLMMPVMDISLRAIVGREESLSRG